MNKYHMREITCFLDDVYNRVADVYVETSVLAAVRRYSAYNLVDKECWAFFCSVVDFGMSVKRRLLPMLLKLIKEIEKRRLKFIDLVENDELCEELLEASGFKHRLLRNKNLIALTCSIRDIFSEYGSLGNLVEELYSKAIKLHIEPMEYVVKEFARTVRKNLVEKVRNKQKVSLIIPDPDKNSAFKRINLFMRWMTRPYPDLGLWKFIDYSHLLVSLDAGIARVVKRFFKLKSEIQTNWEGVKIVTQIFRQIDSEDPAKYDYVFSRPMIMGYCRKNLDESRCYLCPLWELCKSAVRTKLPEGKKKLSKHEEKIFKRFYERYASKLLLKKVCKEYPINSRSIDVLGIDKHGNVYVIEVERELTYEAIGQAVIYRSLYHERKGIKPKAMIVCERAPKDLEEMCRIDANIDVIVV